jgi:hypothetical protein
MRIRFCLVTCAANKAARRIAEHQQPGEAYRRATVTQALTGISDCTPFLAERGAIANLGGIGRICCGMRSQPYRARAAPGAVQ